MGRRQIYFLAIMKRARELFDIVVILPRNSKPDILAFLDKLNIKYEYIDASLDGSPAFTTRAKIQRQWRRIYAEWTSFRYLRRYDLRRSILHIETAPWQSWILITALALRRAHVFVTMHNIMPRTSAWREFLWRARLQFVSRLPRFHIFPSNRDTKERLKGWVANRFFDEMEVAYTAINPDEIDEAVNAELDTAFMRMNCGLDPNAFLVLCVGQFIDRKGRWTFLDAAKQVSKTHKDIAFAWVTPNLPNDVDRERIKDYCLGDAFKLVRSSDLGKDRQDVLRFFSRRRHLCSGEFCRRPADLTA